MRRVLKYVDGWWRFVAFIEGCGNEKKKHICSVRGDGDDGYWLGRADSQGYAVNAEVCPARVYQSNDPFLLLRRTLQDSP